MDIVTRSMIVSGSKSHANLTHLRETVESLWTAVVLAFVLRAFMVEAFVIPTGSMAPRLLGEHWRLTCPACGWEYDYGFMPERADQPRIDRATRHVPPSARCPNCSKGYDGPAGYVNGGDRVLVLKYLYRFSGPKPWDVVVFRNPQNNQENYIKRLIGLPGETLEILRGDIFVADTPEGPRRIRRKPSRAQSAMWQIVYDNNYKPQQYWLGRGLAPQWVAQDPGLWNLTGSMGRRMIYLGGDETDAGAPAVLELQAQRQHFLPSYGYNVPHIEDRMIDSERDVCTDLKLSVVFMPQSPAGRVALHLSSFEHFFQGRLAADGQAELLYKHADWPDDQWELWAGKKLGPIPAGKGAELSLEHVDLGVVLRVDGEIVLEKIDGYPEDYESIKDRMYRRAPQPVPTPQVRIAVDGGGCELRHVRLYRDVYYTASPLDRLTRGPLSQFAYSLGIEGRMTGWGTAGKPITLAKHQDNPDLDEFWMLGDNSPQSLDGRAWTSAAPSLRLWNDQGEPVYQLGTVPRYNLMGKAFFVYWPGGFRMPLLPGLPVIPNVGRMRLIR